MNTIQTFEIYLVGDTPYGYEIEKPFPASVHGYEFSYRFTGKSADICIVSNDGGVDRSIALRFATAIAFKRLRVIHVDLSEVQNWQIHAAQK